MKRTGILGLVAMLLLTTAEAVPPAEDSTPVPLDPVLDTAGLLEMTPKDFAARFPQLKLPRVAIIPETPGFKDIPHAGGRGVTLYGLPVDEVVFRFRGREFAFVSVDFLSRGRGVSMSQLDFEKLIEQCVKSISAKTGVDAVKDLRPESAGSKNDRWRSWPNTQLFLFYSYSTADPSRRIPFRAEFITLFFPHPR